MNPEFFRVSHRSQDTVDTFTLTLECQRPFCFEPGQFNMLYAAGYGEVPISICGNVTASCELLHTIRAVGGVTAALSRLQVNDWVGVRGPFGTAWPSNPFTPGNHVFVAGGIGLAPLRPAILRAIATNERVFLVHGARTPADLLYREEVERWSRLPNVELVVTVDRGDPDWVGATGVVTKYLSRLNFDPAVSAVYTCGPEVMMRFVAREVQKLGVPPDQIYVSLERNMQCGIGHCGHCQLGPHLLCKTGPVLTFDQAQRWMNVREL